MTSLAPDGTPLECPDHVRVAAHALLAPASPERLDAVLQAAYWAGLRARVPARDGSVRYWLLWCGYLACGVIIGALFAVVLPRQAVSVGAFVVLCACVFTQWRLDRRGRGR